MYCVAVWRTVDPRDLKLRLSSFFVSQFLNEDYAEHPVFLSRYLKDRNSIPLIAPDARKLI